MSDEEKKENGGGLSNPAFVPDNGHGAFQDVPIDHEAKETPSAGPSKYEPKEDRRMLKNVIIISLAFTLLFTAFNSMSNLQSSINTAANLGNYTNATLYGALVLSCMFLPTFLISRFTVKWTLVFAMFGYSVYIAAQYEPVFGTMIPAAVVVGLCAAPLWSAKCTYLTHIGHQYAGERKENSDIVIVRFFGIFFLAFQSSQIWGNLISSLVLNVKTNSTRDISICGASFCNSENADTIEQPTDVQRYTLTSIYLACSIAAAIVVSVFVDPLIRYGERERSGDAAQLTGKALFFATFQQMRRPTQLLLIPLTIWSGMEQGFFAADFTQAYVSCAWGVGKVGYVFICYGVCDALASMSFGPVIRKFGRIPVFILGALINVGVIVTLFKWKPDPDAAVVFFVVAGLWGIADAIWQTQINALYGNIFPHNEEPAFSNYRLWESLGFIIAFVSTTQACVNAKLISLLGILGLGMVGYFLVEFLERKKKNKS